MSSHLHESYLVTGGARSGKSRHALGLARGLAARVGVVATARALDADMAARIARHRAERPADWPTVEEPTEILAACDRLAGAVDTILVDCVTVWAANRLLRGDPDEAILAAADALAGFLGARRACLVLVTNEVGDGVHPPTADGLRFRDLLGQVNQRLAAAADHVTLMVAGLPLAVKP
jgi:adenosylcobinamide kinase/adenosylcobinamide-phosphate guanylyltransferase